MKERVKIILPVLLLVLFSGFILRSYLNRPKPPVSGQDYLFNTVVSISLYDGSDRKLVSRCFEMGREYEKRFSKTIEGSEVWNLNHRKPEESVFTISNDLSAMIGLALRMSEKTDGAYDITVEALSTLWNFSGGEERVPEEEAIRQAAAKAGWEKLSLDGNTLVFHDPDVTIDLGSIAKGYIADRMKDYLVSEGVKSAIINLGGNILCIGSRPDGEPFRIGLQTPFEDHNTAFADLFIDGKSVVSSGIYERYFKKGGILYHHILDPKTGWPYENDLVAVTIVSDRSVDGDALSTACFSLGLEKGLALADSLDGVYAYFVTSEGEMKMSVGADSLVDRVLSSPEGEKP